MAGSRFEGALTGLYAITDPALLPQDKLLSGVQAALEGGARIIQYRDKTATEIERLKSAQSLMSLCEDFDAMFIVNDDLDLCLRAKAHGVHLGKRDGDVGLARQKLGDHKVLGVTCHNDLAYAHAMADNGVDYCAFGRVFPSLTKPDAPACKPEELVELTKVPCASVAIGGITVDNASQILNFGVDMLAVIHGVFGQTDIQQAASAFSNLFADQSAPN